jgi:hypothetical protein
MSKPQEHAALIVVGGSCMCLDNYRRLFLRQVHY